ncbi:MAG: hypothetical protein K6U04_02740 [Armatimonadetes bacterium]|nr:hypothetical protein [Armatimonadota bacterium]
MDTMPIRQEILKEIDCLPPHIQKRVLDFARILRSTLYEGVPGRDLLRFAGSISPAEGELMNRAIEEACEQVDPGEW